jgi:hypothetical protein
MSHFAFDKLTDAKVRLLNSFSEFCFLNKSDFAQNFAHFLILADVFFYGYAGQLSRCNPR